VAGERFPFLSGETILTENSHKYDIAAFSSVAGGAGWESVDVWTDDREHFSIHILRPARAGQGSLDQGAIRAPSQV